MWKLLKIASLSDYWENIGFDWSLIYFFYSSFLTEHQWPEAEGGWTVQIHKPHLQLRQQHFQLSAREAAALRRWEDFSFTYLKDKKKKHKNLLLFLSENKFSWKCVFHMKKKFPKKRYIFINFKTRKKKDIYFNLFVFHLFSSQKHRRENNQELKNNRS